MATIEEMNRVIAVYMGWNKNYHDRDYCVARDTESGLEPKKIKNLKYHEDWNEIMPVWSALNKELGHAKQRYDNSEAQFPLWLTAERFIVEITHAIVNVDIARAHSLIFEAIEWLQSNKK